MVAHGAYPAEPLHHHGDFPIGPPLDEALEASKLDDVEAHLVHLVIGVEEERDLAVPLDACQRLDDHPAKGLGIVRGFEGRGHVRSFQS
jgi:hypothetical protein